MPIQHKFFKETWEDGFRTDNAILQTTPYEPEVLFIGTFNPDTSGSHNLAQFFYGRDNYLIPLLHGIFNKKAIYAQSPPYTNILWPLCKQLKLSFADLISCVFPNQTVSLVPNTNQLSYNGKTYNLLKDNHLIEIDIMNEVVWNEKHIAAYINQHSTIKYVYLTQKGDNIFLQKFDWIKTQCNKNISFRCIYTPSGQNLSGIPKELFLCLQWLIQQDQGGKHYGFDLSWLHQHNVRHFTHGSYTLNF